MGNWKGLAMDLLVVVAGVLIASKIKEKMDMARVAPPSAK